jgi:MinD superfamily P-loop ATPase
MKTIAIGLQKGGTGKTTVTPDAELAGCGQTIASLITSVELGSEEANFQSSTYTGDFRS